MPIGKVRPVQQSSVTTGFYGKIPAVGDFLSRRLPREVVLACDEWARQGLHDLRTRDPEGWVDRYQRSPAWSALVPAPMARGFVLLGAIAASHDRVGRRFPLWLLLAMPPGEVDRSLLDDASSLAGGLCVAALRAVRERLPADELDALIGDVERAHEESTAAPSGGDDILEVLGIAGSPQDATTIPLTRDLSPWPQLASSFDPNGSVSYWWTNAAGGAAPRGFTHSGRLGSALFALLFGADDSRSRADGG
jgi:type VI secretion system protein ImpM